MEQDIKRAMARARGYWYEDGISEAVTGALLLLIGGLFFIEAVSPPESLPQSFSAIGLPILLISGFFIGRYAVNFAKSRVTYPRTGEVVYPRKSKGQRKLSSIIGAGIALLISTLVMSGPVSISIIFALQGAVIGLGTIYLAQTVGLGRFFIIGILSVALGSYLTIARFDESLGNAIFYAVVGASLIISGLFTLRSYLAKNAPSQDKEASDGR